MRVNASTTTYAGSGTVRTAPGPAAFTSAFTQACVSLSSYTNECKVHLLPFATPFCVATFAHTWAGAPAAKLCSVRLFTRAASIIALT